MWILFKIFLCSNNESQLEFEGERSVRRLPICINRGKTVHTVKDPLCMLRHCYGIIKVAPNTALFFGTTSAVTC